MEIRQLFLQLNEAYLVIDITAFEPVVLNAAACSLLCTSEDTFIENPLWIDVFTPLLNKEELPNAFVFNAAGGAFQAQLSPLNCAGNAYIALHINHVMPTDQEIHNFYNLIDNLGAYVFCKDLNYRYTYANRRVCDLFEKSLDDIIGKNDHELFCEETGETLVEESDRHVIETGTPIEKEEFIFVPSLNEMRTYLAAKKPLFDDEGNVSGLCGISTDITSQKNTEQQLRDNEQTLNTILDNVGAYIFIKDKDCRFRYINKLTEELFQKSSEDIVGMSNFELLGPEQGDEFERTDREVFSSGQPLRCIETFHDGDDTYYYWTVKIPMKNDSGVIDSYIGISTDITEQKRLEHEVRKSNKKLKKTIKEINLLKDELQLQATHDALTGLYNRRFLEEHTSMVFSEKQRTPTSLIMLDIDHFKTINDRLGHQAGDEILKHLADVMLEECRSTDLICRYGGEEFLILLPATDLQTAFQKAEWIRKEYEISVTAAFPEAKGSSVSIGVAASPNQGADFISVYQAADNALYKAKRLGRNRSSLAE